MKEVKDTIRARVRIAYDGSVHKTFHGTGREDRYATEIKVLKYLESRGCDFVPRLLDCDDSKLYMVTTNCGHVVERMSPEKQQKIFDELETYGVRHADQALRNITYDNRRGRFCVIDFELAEILDEDDESTTAEQPPNSLGSPEESP